MDESKFAGQVLDKIEETKIVPKAKWLFKWKNYLAWGFSGLALLLASLSFTLMIYFLDYSNLPLLRTVSRNFFHFLSLAVPYSWLLLLFGAIALAYSQVKHTDYGYRYSLKKISLISLVFTLMFGSLLYFIGLGRKIDNLILSRSPFYSKVINPRAGFWFNPEGGRLMGLISQGEKDGQLFIMDINKEEWLVDTGSTLRHPVMPLGSPVKLLGEKTAEHKFRADRIMGPGPEEGFIRGRRMMEERMMPIRINE